MALLVTLGGNFAGDCFLIASAASTYPSDLSLATDRGTLAVSLPASPNGAGFQFSQTNLTLSTSTIVQLHETMQSASRGDTTIQVLDGELQRLGLPAVAMIA